MSSPTLRVKSDEIDDVSKRGKYTVSIIDCGQNGVFHAYLFADAGFSVRCVDADQTAIDHITKGRRIFLNQEAKFKMKNYVKTARLEATCDVKDAVSRSDIIIIAVPVKIDEKKKVNNSEMVNVCKRVGSCLQRGCLVIVVSIVGLGVIEGLIRETLENTSGLKVGVDFGLAYSPIAEPEGQTLDSATNNSRIVAALDKNSLEAASAILEIITKKKVKRAQNTKTAELATLFKGTQRDVNSAVANEFALFCEKAGVDCLEVYKLVETDTCSASSLSTPTCGSLQKEPYILLEDAENYNVKMRVPAVARETNEEMVKHVVDMSREALRACGKSLRRARVSLLGISRAQNMEDSSRALVKELTERLESKGAKVNVYDPNFSADELGDLQSNFKRNLTEAAENADCIVVLANHDQFRHLNLKKLKVVMKTPAAIVDVEGIIEPDKVEKEEFIYRGLGRGVWKK